VPEPGFAQVSVILALGGVAGLLAAAMILLVLARRRSNTLGAFLTGLAVAVVVVMLMATPMELFGDSLGGNEIALLIVFVLTLAIGLGAAMVVMNMVFPAKAVEPARERPPAQKRQSARPAPPRPSGPAPDVFISYKRDERPEVLAIARRLEALKLRVWFDAEMRSGTTFDSEIDRQIRSASVVLVCWSPGAIASDWVRGEATIGRQRNVLAAAFLKPCDLPAPFNLIHADDLTAGARPSNPEWLKVVERIGMLTGRPGLAAFEALELAPDKSAYAAWIAGNSSDPLVDVAVSRLKAVSA
jgi:hypothetical protein